MKLFIFLEDFSSSSDIFDDSSYRLSFNSEEYFFYYGNCFISDLNITCKFLILTHLILTLLILTFLILTQEKKSKLLRLGTGAIKSHKKSSELHLNFKHS